MVRHKGVGCQSINRMSAFGPRKRTSSDTTGLSALCPIANIGALHSITSSGAREKRGGTVTVPWFISRRSWQSPAGSAMPDSRHKLRNAGQVFATNRETRIFAAKYT
jgi:hypothetical protein